jgi:hypothetical protein
MPYPAPNQTRQSQSRENKSPHATRLARLTQQAVATFEAPLVDDVLVLFDVAATTNPEEAAVTLCPSTVFASPPAVKVSVYTLNTPDETSLAVIISDSNVTVCSGTETSPKVTSATFPSIARPFVAALTVCPLLVKSGPPG